MTLSPFQNKQTTEGMIDRVRGVVERAREQGYREGYAHGEKEGRALGFAAGEQFKVSDYVRVVGRWMLPTFFVGAGMGAALVIAVATMAPL